MRGRYPDSAEELLEQYEGSAADKRRLVAIMKTVLGEARVCQTCDLLDIGETYYRQLRDRALCGALDGIRPRPAGRPSRSSTPEAERIRALEQALAEKELQLQEALVRAEVALILPQRLEDETVKKGQRPSVNLRKQKPR